MPSTATVKIVNRLGMHARPAMILAETAQEFDADITIRRTDQPNSVDAKSIMQLMMLAATEGTELEIKAAGSDAESSVQRLVDLIRNGFNEE
ncbi:MAG TPA: HPr family phosphocarrier protein [Phycisphaerales bacterium]|nr:HPr family phosphocarrier protein [Phycisphaerales bacterium]|tara:strand:- start:206 stop:481 length:276 start_codon:yes stop_codon:yes gene_type:complete